jgi:hypothetical protein
MCPHLRGVVPPNGHLTPDLATDRPFDPSRHIPESQLPLAGNRPSQRPRSVQNEAIGAIEPDRLVVIHNIYKVNQTDDRPYNQLFRLRNPASLGQFSIPVHFGRRVYCDSASNGRIPTTVLYDLTPSTGMNNRPCPWLPNRYRLHDYPPRRSSPHTPIVSAPF